MRQRAIFDQVPSRDGTQFDDYRRQSKNDGYGASSPSNGPIGRPDRTYRGAILMTTTTTPYYYASMHCTRRNWHSVTAGRWRIAHWILDVSAMRLMRDRCYTQTCCIDVICRTSSLELEGRPRLVKGRNIASWSKGGREGGREGGGEILLWLVVVWPCYG